MSKGREVPAQHMIEVLERELEALDRSLRDSDESTFLWRGRRTAEALLLVLLAQRGKLTRDMHLTLDDLLKHQELKTVLDGRARDCLDSVQRYGNRGSHVQPAEEGFDHAVRGVADALAVLVEWIYTPLQRPVPARARQVAANLRAANARTDGRPAASLPTATHSGGHMAIVPRSDLAGWRHAVAAVIIAVASGGVGFSLARYLPRGEDPPTPGPPTRASLWLVADAASTTREPVTAVTVPDAATEPAVQAMPPDEASGVDAGRGTCPDGTQEFEGGEIVFGEPYPRPWLPDARRTGLRAVVEPFCLDRRAATVAEFVRVGVERHAARAHGFVGAGCNGAGARNAVANCVTQNEAEQFCNLRGMRLPRLTEWEAVARAEGRRRVALVANTAEWVEDVFPSPAWNRGLPRRCGEGGTCFTVRGELLPQSVAPADGARFSWTRRPEGEWQGNIAVRCAWSRDRR